jgi:putative ATP-binding cassette transporter
VLTHLSYMPALKPSFLGLFVAIILGIAVLFASCGGNIPLTSPPATSRYPEIDAYVQKQMAEEDIPGVAVAIVQDGAVIYLRGFGVTSLAHPSPVTFQTVFDLASSTKSFTAMGVLLLEDRGLIDLDAPFQRYVPDFRLADQNSAAKITVRHLLTHTSGIPGNVYEAMAYHEGPTALADLLEALSRIYPDRQPGISFEYANANYGLLQILIESVTGMAFEDYMHEAIFVPLGLEHTTLWAEEASMWDRADGHQPFFGHLIDRDIPAIKSAKAAGWVMSCAEDMAKWLILQLDAGVYNGQQLLPAEDVVTAQTPLVYYEDGGKQIGYGMGWFSGTSDDGTPILWHGGDTPNFMSDMLLVHGADFGVVVLANAQSSSVGHIIGPGIAHILLGIELERASVPWWSYWKTIDTVAIGVMIMSICLLLGLIAFVWYHIRQLLKRRCHLVLSPWAKITMPRYLFLFNITPLFVVILITAVAYVVIKTFFGFNYFWVLLEFRLASPPGIWMAGVTFLVATFLWSLLLALVALFTRESTNMTNP